jgi:hypothetical protein
MGTAVAALVDAARHNCAVTACALSDFYAVDAVRKLAPTARAYLLQLFGLDPNQRSAASQAARIEAHRTLHHLDLAGENDKVSAANGPRGGGGNGGCCGGDGAGH